MLCLVFIVAQSVLEINEYCIVIYVLVHLLIHVHVVYISFGFQLVVGMLMITTPPPSYMYCMPLVASTAP